MSWVDKSRYETSGEWWVMYERDGNLAESVHVVKSKYGVPTDNGDNFGWCYYFNGCGTTTKWMPMPDHVETLEEAKALALVLWRMGE